VVLNLQLISKIKRLSVHQV